MRALASHARGFRPAQRGTCVLAAAVGSAPLQGCYLHELVQLILVQRPALVLIQLLEELFNLPPCTRASRTAHGVAINPSDPVVDIR